MVYCPVILVFPALHPSSWVSWALQRGRSPSDAVLRGVMTGPVRLDLEGTRSESVSIFVLHFFFIVTNRKYQLGYKRNGELRFITCILPFSHVGGTRVQRKR